MSEMTDAIRHVLINAIAAREGNARELSERFQVPIPELRAFVEENRDELHAVRERIEQEEADGEPSPSELDGLWISKKFERLKRLQDIADLLYKEAQHDPTDSTVLREFRSYLTSVANELGQLLNRGAGESGADTLNVEITGVDMNKLR